MSADQVVQAAEQGEEKAFFDPATGEKISKSYARRISESLTHIINSEYKRRVKQAQKEEAKKTKAQSQPAQADKEAAVDEEQLDPRQYFEIRKKTIAQMSARAETPLNAYPHKFQTTISVPDFIAKYAHVKDGEQLKEVPITLAGRVHSVRAAGKKLKFYDLHADGTKVQIHANAAYDCY